MPKDRRDSAHIIPTQWFNSTQRILALVQNLLILQQYRRVHWRHSAQTHDQHVTWPSPVKLNLEEAAGFGLCQKQTFAAV